MVDSTSNNKRTILFDVKSEGVEELQQKMDAATASAKRLRAAMLGLGKMTGKDPSLNIENKAATGGGTKSIEKEQRKFKKSTDEATVALEKQTKALNKHNKEVKKGAEELSHWDKVLEELTGNWSKRAGIFMSYRLLAGITNVVEGSLSSIYNLQKEFANIQAITASSDSEIAKLSGTILDLGTQTRYATEELAKATVILGQAGLNAGQIESVLKSVSELATATGTDLSTSVDIMTSTMGAWNKTAKESADIADTLVVAANKTKAELSTMGNAIKYAGVAAADLGVSFEEFVAIASAVTDVGLKGTNVGTGLRSVITELANPTKKLEKVFTRLGVSLEEVDIRSRGLQSVLQTLKDAGLGAQEAAEGFDRRAATFYLAATAQLDSVKSLREAFLEEGAALRANETQMNTLSAQAERFANIVKKDLYGAFKPLLDILTAVLKIINDILSVPYLGGFTGRLLTLVTAHKALKSVVIGVDGAFSKLLKTKVATNAIMQKTLATQALYTLGFKRIAVQVGKLQATLKGVTVVAKSFLKTFLIGAALTGITYLLEAISKTSSSLEDLTNKSAEQQEELSSLATAYQELTEKGILYSNDTDALAIRIQELNKQFKLQGDELISLSAKYDEVLKKMLEVRQARFDESVTTDVKRANSIRGKYYVYPRGPLDTGGIIDPFVGKGLISEGKLFDQLVRSDEATLKGVQDFINAMTDKAWKSRLTQMMSDAAEYRKLAEGVEAATKLTTEDASEIQKIIVDSTTKTNEALESYRQNLQDTLGSKSEFSIDKLYGVAKTQLDALRKEYYILSQQVNQMDLSGVSKSNPTYISAKEQMLGIKKTISSIEENINENAKAIVKGSLAQAENSIKNITKLLNTAKTSQPDDKLLKQVDAVRNTLIEAVSENTKREIESITYEKGSFLYNREVERINQNSEAMIAQYTASLDKATFNYLHNIEKIIETLRNATRNAELSKSRIERSDRAGNGGYLALSSAIGSIGNFTQGDTSISQALSGAITNTNYGQQAKNAGEAERIRKKEKDDLTEQLALVVKINKEKKTQLANYITELQKSQKLVEEGLLTEEEKTKQLIEQERLKGSINELERIVTQGDTAENALLNQVSTIAGEERGLEATEAYLTDLENTKQKWGSLAVGAKKGMFAALGDDVKDLQSFDKRMEAIGAKGFTTFVDNFTDAVTQFANSEKSFSAAMKEFVTNSLRDIGNWLIQLGIKAAIYAAMEKMFPTFFAAMQGFGLVGQVGAQTVSTGAQVAQTKAAGGMIRGGVANRDSVNARLMPGEYVLKKSAVDYLGENFLNSLNQNTEQTLNAITPEVGVMGDNGGQSVVNVWVVSKEEQAGMGPNDVIATITKDIRTGGTTRQLIKTVIAGRK